MAGQAAVRRNGLFRLWQFACGVALAPVVLTLLVELELLVACVLVGAGGVALALSANHRRYLGAGIILGAGMYLAFFVWLFSTMTVLD